MKAYPSISTSVDFSLPYWVFDKIDGSNLRAEWTPKRGFYKFGSRTQLLTPDQSTLWPAVARLEALEPHLRAGLAALKTPRCVLFFEWAGPSSFAGSHHDPVQDMGLFLLDVDVYQRGRLAMPALLDLADGAGVKTPALLHHGRIDPAFLAQVRRGDLPGITCEGVVGKGPAARQEGGPVMFKHKTQAWLDRLRAHCGQDEALFQRLA